jgi:hypothetical protein
MKTIHLGDVRIDLDSFVELACQERHGYSRPPASSPLGLTGFGTGVASTFDWRAGQRAPAGRERVR